MLLSEDGQRGTTTERADVHLVADTSTATAGHVAAKGSYPVDIVATRV